ncbi:MAG: hypothetical protein C5B43_00870 [Verrucomicrobia bacterium]|nr:MAG: hypothetical protein C5B43_00870 [Verrucomicrobiota bacterium]
MTKDASILTALATLSFIQDNTDLALEKLEEAIELDSNCFSAWLAKAEILFSSKNFDAALQAAERAQQLSPEDVCVHTTLSRIWIEKEDKKKAEKFSLRARTLGWKEVIKNNKKTCRTV